MTDPELVEVPCPHLRPGDPSVRLNIVTGRAHYRFVFCGPCAREIAAGFVDEIETTFPRGRVGV